MAEQWEVRASVYSCRKDEFTIWPVGAPGNGKKRIADWIKTRETADLLCAAPALLAACEEVEKWWLEQGQHENYGAPACIFLLRATIAEAKGQPHA